MKKIKVGIIGSAGYTGGELIRILIHHPQVEIVFAHSASNAGNKVYQVHQDLFGDTELTFSESFHSDIDVVFLCVGHGDARKFLAADPFNPDVRIIDLSQDFRLRENRDFRGRQFIYGLPELNRAKIESAHDIANPGCFATTIQLALLPLAEQALLPEQVQVHATTGSTGAGQRPSGTTHFSWRNNNLSIYQAFVHRHLQEVSESLDQLQAGFLPPPADPAETLVQRAAKRINFVPQRGDFPRGIFATVYLQTDLSLEQASELYRDYYAGHPFTHLSDMDIDLKQVVNTNKGFLQLQKQGDTLLILSATDNLIKGASGQAVQNMNLMYGLDESAGLRLKPSAF